MLEEKTKEKGRVKSSIIPIVPMVYDTHDEAIAGFLIPDKYQKRPQSKEAPIENSSECVTLLTSTTALACEDPPVTKARRILYDAESEIFSLVVS